MLKVKLSYAALMVSVALGVYSCGGDSSDDPIIEVPFSLGISDAFINEADKVVITIDEIHLIPVVDDEEGGETIVIHEFNDLDKAYVDLIKLPGSEQLTLVSEDDNIVIPVGRYKLELLIDSEHSFVKLLGDNEPICESENSEDQDDLSAFVGEGCYDIKVPSSRLRLGEFDVVLGATETVEGPAYTLEFVLSQSLVLRGNDPSKSGFIIKPHGVRITTTTTSGHIRGNVALTDLGCGDMVNAVYLYEGNLIENGGTLADNFDSFLYPQVESIKQPFASTVVVTEGDSSFYEFGFVPTDVVDIYTIALACDLVGDDAELYEVLPIPMPLDQVSTIKVETGETVELDFELK